MAQEKGGALVELDKGIASEERRIATQQKVKQFVASVPDEDWPYCREILLAVISDNGNGSSQNQGETRGPHSGASAIARSGDIEVVPPTNNHAHGSLTRAVELAVAALRGTFTSREVMEKMEANGFVVEAERPIAAVGKVLAKLAKQDRIHLEWERSGSAPAGFKKRRNFARPAE